MTACLTGSALAALGIGLLSSAGGTNEIPPLAAAPKPGPTATVPGIEPRAGQAAEPQARVLRMHHAAAMPGGAARTVSTCTSPDANVDEAELASMGLTVTYILREGRNDPRPYIRAYVQRGFGHTQLVLGGRPLRVLTSPSPIRSRQHLIRELADVCRIEQRTDMRLLQADGRTAAAAAPDPDPAPQILAAGGNATPLSHPDFLMTCLLAPAGSDRAQILTVKQFEEAFRQGDTLTDWWHREDGNSPPNLLVRRMGGGRTILLEVSFRSRDDASATHAQKTAGGWACPRGFSEIRNATLNGNAIAADRLAEMAAQRLTQMGRELPSIRLTGAPLGANQEAAEIG